MTSRLWVCCSNQLSYKSDIHLVKITILMIADAKVRLFLEPCKFFIIFFVFLLSYGRILLGLTDGAGGVNGWNVFLGHRCWRRERWGESCSRREPWRGIFWGMVIYVCVITMRASLASPSRLTRYGHMCMCNSYESISCFSISPHRYGHMCMCNSYCGGEGWVSLLDINAWWGIIFIIVRYILKKT